jgi:hypothetical protein
VLLPTLVVEELDERPDVAAAELADELLVLVADTLPDERVNVDLLSLALLRSEL